MPRARFAAFLRAINVGGRTVTMDRLRAVFESLRLSDVTTVINSGNVLFASGAKDITALERRIERALEKELGYEVVTFVRSAAEVATIAADEPFGTVGAGDLVQIGFLKHAPTGDVTTLATTKDELEAKGRELYWHVRGRTMESQVRSSELAKALGGPTTMRNVTTVRKIAALLTP